MYGLCCGSLLVRFREGRPLAVPLGLCRARISPLSSSPKMKLTLALSLILTLTLTVTDIEPISRLEVCTGLLPAVGL